MTYSPIPKWTIIDTNGDPVVGGTLEFFAAGTTTPKDVFSDAARTVSLGSTETTDALGQVGPIYLDTAAATKVVCKDASGVTLWTVDSLTAPSGETAAVSAVSRSVSPLDYGAIGDGAADESNQVQQALDAGVGLVDLAGKTYRCDSTLTLPAGTRLINGTLNFAQMASGSACLTAIGSLGTGVLCTSDANGGDEKLTLASTASFTTARWVKVSSNSQWGATPSTKDGELAKIWSVFSGTKLYLDARLMDTYTTAASAQAQQLTTVSGIAIEDVRVIGTTLVSAAVMSFRYGERISIRNCSVNLFLSDGIVLDTCVDCVVDSVQFDNSNAGTAVAFKGTSQRCTVTNAKITDVGRGIQIGSNDDGVCRYIEVAGGSLSGGTDVAGTAIGVAFGQDSQYCSVDNASIHVGRGGTSYGVRDYGSNNRIGYCRIIGANDAAIYSELRRAKSVVFNSVIQRAGLEYVGNTISTLGDGIHVTGYTATAVASGLVADNVILYAASEAIKLVSVAGLTDMDVRGNKVGTCDSWVCEVSGAGAVDRLRIRCNEAQSARAGIQLDCNANWSNIGIVDNEINEFDSSNLGNLAVDVDVATTFALTGLRIDGNRFTTANNGTCLLLNPADAGALTRFSVSGNRLVVAGSSPTQYVIDARDVYQGRVSGNEVYGGTGGVRIQSVDAGSGSVGRVRIADNEFDCLVAGPTYAAPDSVVLLHSTSTANGVDDCVVRGNIVTGADAVSGVASLMSVYADTGCTASGHVFGANVLRCIDTGVVGLLMESVDADGIVRCNATANNIDAASEAIDVTNCKYIGVSGNTARRRATAPGETIRVDSSDVVHVSSNIVINDDSADTASSCVLVTGTVDAVAVTGNHADGGYQALHETATSTDLAAIGNLCTNFGAGGALNPTTWDLGTQSNTAADFKNGF